MHPARWKRIYRDYKGEHEATLGTAGKVTVPAAFRHASNARSGKIEHNNPEFLYFIDQENNRLIVSDPDTLESKIQKASDSLSFIESTSTATHTWAASDGGTVSVPVAAIEALGLKSGTKSKLKFIGCVDHFQVYSMEKWSEIRDERLKPAKKFIKTFRAPEPEA